VIVLAVLRHAQRQADMAGGNSVSESTVRRWRDELIALLAAQAPRLDRVLKKVAKRGGEVVLIDGTLIPTQRRTGKADRRNYSGRHHHHGLHFLALTDEKGRLIWISAARPVDVSSIVATSEVSIRTGSTLRRLPGELISVRVSSECDRGSTVGKMAPWDWPEPDRDSRSAPTEFLTSLAPALCHRQESPDELEPWS
jgi:hypothetical protein